MSSLVDSLSATELAMVVGGPTGWFILYGAILLFTRPARPRPSPPTQDLGGDEPPAVVNLLANHWRVTEEAAEATVLDLAARRHLELRQPGDDPRQTTIHVRTANPADLTSYERRVFDRVAGLAVNGMLPLTALAFRDRQQASTWARRFRAEVVADARNRGLSRRRMSVAMEAILIAGAIAVGMVIGLVSLSHVANAGDAVGMGLSAMVVLAVIGLIPRGERDTERGREVAGRWLGLRAYLSGDESFAELPPAAVAVWDRYLPYGGALGTTRVCAAIIDLGLGDRRRVWSSYGGTWHRVRVRYPKGWPRYGQPARGMVVRSLLAAMGGVALVWYWPVPLDAPWGQARGESVANLVGWGAVPLLGYALYTLVFSVGSALAPTTVTGEVLWVQVWRSSQQGEGDSVPESYHLAVDDGTHERTVAWALPAALAGRCEPGDTVTIQVRRWTRRVLAVTVVRTGQARALIEVDPSAIDLDGGGVASQLAGLGAQLLSGATQQGETTRDHLVTADEVSQALGLAVRANPSQAPAVGPMATQTYHAVSGGRQVLMVQTARGPLSALAIRARRGHPPVPGVGDEAYAGPNWVAARRGDRVVVLLTRGEARRTDQQRLHWLLTQAVARL